MDVLTYKARLDRDWRWAMTEGDRYFSRKSAVFLTMRDVARRLAGLGIPYAVAGAMAMFHHGYRRFTENLDVLVPEADLGRALADLAESGYAPPAGAGGAVTDVRTGVAVRFRTADSLPAARVEADGVWYVALPRLVGLKIAGGMTGLARMKDLGDVIELIKALDLPAELGDRLDLPVRDKYRELWWAARPLPPEVAEMYGFPDDRAS